jgi:adenylate kinase family enzyme
MIDIIEAEERIGKMFLALADVSPTFDDDYDTEDLAPWPLAYLTKGEVEGTATLYERFNGTVVLRIDSDVITVTDSPEVRKWVTSRTGWMPFVQARLETVDGSRVKVIATHSFLADEVTQSEIEQVLGSFDFVVEKWSEALIRLEMDTEMEARTESVRRRTERPKEVQEGPDASATADESTEAARTPEGGLDEMVGLIPVKNLVKQITNVQKVARVRRRNGLNAVVPSPHLVFTGNPGTGKTTVARHIGRIYKQLGLLSSGQLVGGYIGQTAIKTREALDSARGGVLFVDEAYSLARDHANDYGHEAIETILAYMENNRGNIVVVVAGYPAEMKTFMAMNPGLASRFDYSLQFPDYSNDELSVIFERLANEFDYDLDEIARDALKMIVSSWEREHGFGNAREVRRLFNEVVAAHGAWLIQQGITSGVALRQLTSVHFPVGEALAAVGARERDAQIDLGGPGYL